jgi:hypothetical protein
MDKKELEKIVNAIFLTGEYVTATENGKIKIIEKAKILKKFEVKDEKNSM